MRVGASGVLLCAGLSLLACSPQSDQELLPVSRLEVEAGCDVLAGCRVSDMDTYIEVLFEMKPRALQPFPVAVKPGDMKDVEAVAVSFSMRGMAMGLNRYVLAHTAEGGWHGEVTLPVCASGRTDWIAEFEILMPDRRLAFAVPFVLDK